MSPGSHSGRQRLTRASGSARIRLPQERKEKTARETPNRFHRGNRTLALSTDDRTPIAAPWIGAPTTRFYLDGFGGIDGIHFSTTRNF